jgi:hypothetical protein
MKSATPHPVQHDGRCTTREAPPRINLVSDALTCMAPACHGPPPRIPPRVHTLTGFSTQEAYVHTCGGAHAVQTCVRRSGLPRKLKKIERKKEKGWVGTWKLGISWTIIFQKLNPPYNLSITTSLVSTLTDRVGFEPCGSLVIE